MAELRAFEKTAKRLLAMPKPDHLIELTTDPNEEPECGYSGGDGPAGRRKWRNGVVTAMVHKLIEDAGVSIARTGKSIYSEGSPSMKLMARVLDCLDPREAGTRCRREAPEGRRRPGRRSPGLDGSKAARGAAGRAGRHEFRLAEKPAGPQRAAQEGRPTVTQDRHRDHVAHWSPSGAQKFTARR